MPDDFETMPSAHVGDAPHGRHNEPRRHLPYANIAPHLRHSIHDAASVLGIPANLITPEIHHSISVLMDEVERLRWEVERSHHHEQWLENNADLDPVLPIGNRRVLLRRLDQLIARMAETRVDAALILVRVPMVGELLATEGLAAADAAEHLIARELVATVRQTDLVAHLATGEFAVLLTVTEPAGAEMKVQQVQMAMAGLTVAVGDRVVPLEGAVAWRLLDLGATGEQMLRATDGDLRAATATP